MLHKANVFFYYHEIKGNYFDFKIHILTLCLSYMFLYATLFTMSILNNKPYHMTSIHQKITLSFSVLALIIGFLSIFAYIDLLFLEKQVTEGEIVTNFKDNILEMRRHEKNLLLYHNIDELHQALEYTDQAINSLKNHQQIFNRLKAAKISQDILFALIQYKKVLSTYDTEWELFNGETSAESIRPIGQTISSMADQLAQKERVILGASINSTQWALAGAILITALFTIFVGFKLARAVLTPLRNLETELAPIAEGQFDHFSTDNKEQEIIALANALNRMLYELELRQKRMLQAEKLASLGVLVSGVAHELNNPLGNILSSCQLLNEELDSADPSLLKDWLHQIDNETERAYKIVRTLQDFGRQKEFFLEPVQLLDLVNRTLLLLKNELTDNCLIIKDIPADLFVKADPQRLQQALINLIKNALDSATKQLEISIRATPCRKKHQAFPEQAYVLGNLKPARSEEIYTEIVIMDNGPGIPGKIIKKIFDPFFTTRDPGKGMGIGLYIVQEIIQEHNGVIAVVSDIGTQFIIHLPCQKSPAQRQNNA